MRPSGSSSVSPPAAISSEKAAPHVCGDHGGRTAWELNEDNTWKRELDSYLVRYCVRPVLRHGRVIPGNQQAQWRAHRIRDSWGSAWRCGCRMLSKRFSFRVSMISTSHGWLTSPIGVPADPNGMASRDLLPRTGAAHSGSGRTAAFSIPQAIVLAGGAREIQVS